MKSGMGNGELAIEKAGALLLPPLEKGATGDLLLIFSNVKSKSPSIPLFQRGRSMPVPHSPFPISGSAGVST